MQYSVKHTTTYIYTEPVSICHNRAHLAPRTTDYQSCAEYRLEIDPMPAICLRRDDCFGNAADFFSIQEAHKELRVTAMSVVEVLHRPNLKLQSAPDWETVAKSLRSDSSKEGLEAYYFSLPSPRIAHSPALREYATPSFPCRRPIAEAVRDLTARIHADFTFDPRATTVHTSPESLLKLRRGVCQDFAHFAIGCLRSLGLAARYVSGYVRTLPPPGMPPLVGADASHAWNSVHCGPAGWVDFDPTSNVLVDDSHVTIGWGRDYGDVGPIQGVFVGGGDQSMTVGVDVVPMVDES